MQTEVSRRIKAAVGCARVIMRPPNSALPAEPNGKASLVLTFSVLLGLTHAESRTLAALATADYATRQDLHRALSPSAEIRIVDVNICRLRQKLRPFGIKISTIWGIGFRLDPSFRDTLRTLLAEYGASLEAQESA